MILSAKPCCFSKNLFYCHLDSRSCLICLKKEIYSLKIISRDLWKYKQKRHLPPSRRYLFWFHLQYKIADYLANLNNIARSEEHTSELQSRFDLVCRLLLEKKNTKVIE